MEKKKITEMEVKKFRMRNRKLRQHKIYRRKGM